VALTALHQEAKEELLRFVADEGKDFPAIEWVWRALRTRGKLLADEEGFTWGLLPLLVCADARGDPRQAFPLAVAVECLIAATDVLDDVQDGDNADGLWRVCGLASATNVATLLLFLSQLALGRLAQQGVPGETTAAIARLFGGAGARACAGQQHDLDAARGAEIDEDTYLATSALKSASLVECACRAGAVLGRATPEAVDAYAQFGVNVGMALQINNDIAGASSESADRNDLRAGKRTLPMIFALEHAPASSRADLGGILRPGRQEDLCPAEIDRVRQLLAATGALQYAVVVADLYWEHAMSCLERAGCGPDSDLRRLVAQMRDA